jgi:hypothetical protein
MSELAERLAAMIGASEDLHWTVLLDRALRDGIVPPSPQARHDVLAALADGVREGKIRKTSTGTYAAASE